jgi:hypothetical protein
VSNSVQFDQNGRPMSDVDHQHLNRSISNEGRPAAHGAAGAVRVNQSGFASFNTGAGFGAQAGVNGTQVQLKADQGTVKVAGFEVTPETEATLRKQAPELFVPEEEKQAKVVEAQKSAADEEAERAEINRYKDDAVEGVAMHISNDVDFGDQTRLLWELHSTGNVSDATLNRVADQLHLSVGETVDALNAISTHSSLQLAALCGAAGVDASAFSQWMKQDHSTAMFKAVQVATQERDIQRAWGSHIAAFKARGGVR